MFPADSIGRLTMDVWDTNSAVIDVSFPLMSFNLGEGFDSFATWHLFPYMFALATVTLYF